MATKQFITLENLSLFKDLMDQVISEGDAKAIKAAALNGKKLELYTQENPTAQDTPRFSITLPFTQQEIISANGKSLVWNEASGGGAKFENVDGTWSYVGVNDGGENGLAAQIYALKKNENNKYVGTRINVTKNGIYYTNGADSMAYTAGDEIATMKDLGETGSGKTVYLKDESQGQSEYAKVYKLYQGSDPLDMSQNTFVGQINIPLDKVVQDGHIVTVTGGVDSDGEEVPIGIADGTYIKLTFQNVAQAVYINVHDLVDVYTGGTTAEITISIDANNEITATINEINGSKLADGSVAKAKLVSSVQDSLDLADTALQDEDIRSVDDEDIEALFNNL